MTPQDLGIKDIFEGAEQIEIFGKLPALLWAYIGAAHTLVEQVNAGSTRFDPALEDMTRLLEILDSAAKRLGNTDLQERLAAQSHVVTQINSGDLSGAQLVSSLAACLPLLEQVAGPRPDNSENPLTKDWLEQEMVRAEKIKTGRSADVIVSMEVLEDIRDYLSREAVTEGISSILVIDNAGTLIVNMGSRVELDAVALAAVAAANFAATEQIARLIGERDFVLLFYKGHSESFHFSRVGKDYIIVTIFDNSLSLGLLRLKIAEVVQALESKLPRREA